MLAQISTILISILIVMSGVFLVSKYQVWFENHRLKLISVFMILGISIYTIGYLTKSPLDYFSSGLMAIFSTGRMFVFENDLSSFETDVLDIPYYGILFGLIMTFSMLTTGMIVLSFFGYRVMCKIQLEFMRFFSYKKKIYVFTKLSEKALLLAGDIKKNNIKSIIIFCVNSAYETDENKKLEKAASECKYIIFQVSSNMSIYHLCRQIKKNKIVVFAIGNDDNQNIAFVMAFAKRLESIKNVRHIINLYAFVKNNEYEELFNENIHPGVEIQIIEESDLASRQLFNKFTLTSCMRDLNTLTVCVIGYTEISENLFRNILYLGQCHDVKLKLLLVDEGIQDKTAVFFNKNPEVNKCAEFELLNIKPNTAKFFEYFENNMRHIHCIIIANDNTDTATEISRMSVSNAYKITVCVHMKNYDQCNMLFERWLLKDVIIFGSEKDIFMESIIINEKLDMLAKGVHNYYALLYQDTRLWSEISLFEKQSSRALALHIQSKLYSIGLKYRVGGDTELFDEQIKDSTVLEHLAIGEHLRWNAYSYVNGWRTMQSIETKERNKDALLKTHSCLVDWDELDHVSERFNKDYKEMDRHLIRSIGHILKSVGLGIEKIEDH